MADFYTLITNVGLAKLANAEITGNKVLITEIAVGDGLNGKYYNPTQTQTALKNEVWRDSVSNKFIDPNNSNKVIFEAQIPINIGGWYIREIGAFDADGDLIAISKVAESYKPTNQEGGADEYLIRIPLLYSNTSAVNIIIDPAVVLATRQYVDQSITRNTGRPEGIVTANKGAFYEDTATGVVYRKTTDNSNTGWRQLNRNNQYHATDFGTGTLTSTTLQSAITALGIEPCELVIKTGTWTFTQNITVPANIRLIFERGAKFNHTGYTLSLQGGFNDKDITWQIFQSDNSVSIGKGTVEYVTPVMFGAVRDGITDDSGSINRAISSWPTVFAPAGDYGLASPIKIKKNTNLYGNAYAYRNDNYAGNSTIFRTLSDIHALAIENYAVGFDLKNFYIRNNTALGSSTKAAIYMDTVLSGGEYVSDATSAGQYSRLDAIHICNFKYGIYMNDWTFGTKVYDVHIERCFIGVGLYGSCAGTVFYNPYIELGISAGFSGQYDCAVHIEGGDVEFISPVIENYNTGWSLKSGKALITNLHQEGVRMHDFYIKGKFYLTVESGMVLHSNSGVITYAFCLCKNSVNDPTYSKGFAVFKNVSLKTSTYDNTIGVVFGIDGNGGSPAYFPVMAENFDLNDCNFGAINWTWSPHYAPKFIKNLMIKMKNGPTLQNVDLVASTSSNYAMYPVTYTNVSAAPATDFLIGQAGSSYTIYNNFTPKPLTDSVQSIITGFIGPYKPCKLNVIANADGVAGSVIIYGTDSTDAAIQETIAINQTAGAIAVTAATFKTVTKVDLPVQTHTGDTIDIQTGYYDYDFKSAHAVVNNNYYNSTVALWKWTGSAWQARNYAS